MAKVLIYSTKVCPYCVRAKSLLDAKGVSYDEILIDTDDAARAEMMEKSGRRTVPQIFIDGQSVGGFDDLYALDKAGKLDDMLNN
ncbi:MAG: glutaredoxin 3 [Legionellales bacterium]|nr:glutaredoxin 3 [Legionellales bacterium]|tara:strand:+ start:742 stop:996 length:255 start_codon:yes stop_codon:yes gene_type:complete